MVIISCGDVHTELHSSGVDVEVQGCSVEDLSVSVALNMQLEEHQSLLVL